MDRSDNHAEDYADVIANELAELEAALVGAYRYAYEGEGEPPTFDGEAFEDPQDVMHHYYEGCALSISDVVATGRSGGDVWTERRYVEVLRTYGGPNAYVRFYGDGRASVRVYWGSGEAVRRVACPMVDAELWELMDATAAVRA
jgi:hypothetical protein